MRKYKLSLPLPDITGVWVFSLGVWFHIVGRLVYRKPWMAFFLAELIAIILVLSGAYRVGAGCLDSPRQPGRACVTGSPSGCHSGC